MFILLGEVYSTGLCDDGQERYMFYGYFHGSRGITINRLIMETGGTGSVNAKYTIAQKYGLPILDNIDYFEHY